MANQPKFKVSDKDLFIEYKEELTIPEEEKCSQTVVARVGDKKVASDGNTYVPILLIQARNDTKPQSSKSDRIFRGWGIPLIRHVENVILEIFTDQDFKEGMIMEDVELALDKSLKPFYEDQKPIRNTRTQKVVTCGGEPVYRQTRVCWEAAEHQGLDIVYDKIKTEEIIKPVVEEVNQVVDFDDEEDF